MSRVKKALVVISLVLSITAIQVPASATPVTDSCPVANLLAKYGWNVGICV